MGEVVKFKPKYELDCEKAVEQADDLKALLKQPDTAPCEFTAPMDDSA